MSKIVGTLLADYHSQSGKLSVYCMYAQILLMTGQYYNCNTFLYELRVAHTFL